MSALKVENNAKRAEARRKVRLAPVKNDQNTDQQASQKDTANGRSKNNTESFAATLLSFEGNVRAINSDKELFAHLCNDARRILAFRQAFFLKRPVQNADFRVVSASSIPVIDREAPTIRWIEKITRRLIADTGEQGQHTFSLPAYCDAEDEEKSNYPFTEVCWTPVIDGDITVGGFLTTREMPWANNDAALAKRLCDLYAHSWSALHGRGRLTRKKIITKKRSILGALILAVISLIPVPLTALAPVEVSPADPFIVAAPFNGVVKEILVDQSEPVTAGDPIIAFEDVRQRNEFEIADRRAAVTAARLQRVAQRAIADPQVKRDLSVAQAEYDLANVERDYAAELLAKTTLSADRNGIAVYSDKRDWIGRPVSAGEAILEIADPAKIHFTIDLPVDESIVLKKGAQVKVFLDSDPLKPIKATLTQTSYQPRADDRDIMSYRLAATLNDPEESRVPRIGIQGTAQVYGQKAPIIYAVLRRPLASLRQMTGL